MNIEATTKHVDIEACNLIQSKVAEYAARCDIIANENDMLAMPYTEGFYDNCIVFWEEAGYDRDEVRETVDAAVKELKATYA